MAFKTFYGERELVEKNKKEFDAWFRLHDFLDYDDAKSLWAMNETRPKVEVTDQLMICKREYVNQLNHTNRLNAFSVATIRYKIDWNTFLNLENVEQADANEKLYETWKIGRCQTWRVIFEDETERLDEERCYKTWCDENQVWGEEARQIFMKKFTT